MAHQLFQLPKPTALSSNLTLLAGAKVEFFLTGTTTPTPVYQDSGLTTPHTNPVIADSAGRLPPIYLDPSIVYKATFKTTADVDIYPAVDPINDQLLSQAIIGGYLYPRTVAEIAAGVTPVNYAYPPGDIRRYGGDPTFTNDSTVALQTIIDLSALTGFTPTGTRPCGYIPPGHYKISDSLTMRFQMCIYGDSEYTTVIEQTDPTKPIFENDSAITPDFARTSISRLALRAGTYAHKYTLSGSNVQSLGEWTRVRFENQTVGAVDCDQYFLLNTFTLCVFSNCGKSIRCGSQANGNHFIRCRFENCGDDIVTFLNPGGARGGEINVFRGCRFEARDAVSSTGGTVFTFEDACNSLIEDCYFEDTWKQILTETTSTRFDTTVFRNNKFTGQEKTGISFQSEIFDSDGIVTFENNFFETGTSASSTCDAFLIGRNRGINTSSMRLWLDSYSDESGRVLTKPWTPTSGVAVDLLTITRSDTTNDTNNHQVVAGEAHVAVSGVDSGGSPFALNYLIPFVVRGLANGTLAATIGSALTTEDNGPAAALVLASASASASSIKLQLTLTEAGFLAARIRAELAWRISFGEVFPRPIVTVNA